MKWTEAQEHIIESRNKNMLVSAAAGSGKTAVLIERIKQMVLKDNVNIDEFLITTFTNAASLEMKERLNAAIRKEIESKRGDLKFLRKQLSMMPKASIGTFHNFSLEIIKRYFYLTDLEPGFSIGDDIQISIMKKESVDELFDKRFESDYDAFTAFLRKYSSDRSENRLKDNVITIYDELRSIPDYMSWAEEKAKMLQSDSPSENTGIAVFILKEAVKNISEAAKMYGKAADTAEKAGVESIYSKAEQDAEKVEQAAGMLEHIYSCLMENKCTVQEAFRETADIVGGFSFNTMRAAKSEQEDYIEIKDKVSDLRKAGKKLIDDLASRYFAREMEDYDAELKRLHGDTEYYVGLLKEFEEIFKEKKHEKNIIDFDDVMHYALEILKNDMAAEEYRGRYRYIFIDEFQDSNMLQEMIIGKISRENNVFMVGDVKQSIYKFRLAEPEIFKRKYEEYSRKTSKNSEKIDLNSNFRSKYSVTRTVNEVFSDVMDDYGENEKLHCAVGMEHEGLKSRMTLIDKSLKSEDDFFEDAETEAEVIADIIRENTGKTVYDVKRGEYRKLCYKDIVVLSRSRNSISGLERYLNNSGIPAYGDNSEGYFESVEIQVFVNFLKIIDNTRRDVPLISVMRSMIFGFGEQELAQIRIEFEEGSFYSAAVRYSEEGSDEELKTKTSEMFRTLGYWKAVKKTVTLEELLRRLLYETGYFDYCSGLPVGKQRISNLRLLVEKAAEFEEKNYSGLYGFLTYIDAMKRNNISTGEARTAGEDENAVRIMTVHKSKGLEFPVVILSGAGRRIRPKGSGNTASLHKDFGIGLPSVNRAEGWHRKTLLQRAIERKKADEEIDEEVRILYVALTRAIDRIEVTGSVKDSGKLDENDPGKKSFVDMMYSAFVRGGDDIVIRNSGDVKYADDRYFGKRAYVESLSALIAGSEDEDMYDKINERLSYVYPYTSSKKVKSKYSVTELNDAFMKKDEKIELRFPQFSQEKKGLNAAEIGTVMHKVMEKLDFKTALEGGMDYIEEKIDEMKEGGTLTEEESGYVKAENIAGFFDSEMGKRASLSTHSEKEREFILLKNIEGEDTIVQGVIDFFFEENDGLVLIDYKNSYVSGGTDDREIVSRYKEQISLYEEALEAAKNKKVKESYLYMFNSKKFIKVR